LNGWPHDGQNFAIEFCRGIPHWEQNPAAGWATYGGGGGIWFCCGKYGVGWITPWLNW